LNGDYFRHVVIGAGIIAGAGKNGAGHMTVSRSIGRVSKRLDADSGGKFYKFEDDSQTLNIRLNIGMTGFGKSALLAHQLRSIVQLNKRLKRDKIILLDPSSDDFHFSWFGRRVSSAKEINNVAGRPIDAFHLRVISRDEKLFDYVCWLSRQHEDVFLLIDEVWNFIPTKAGARMEPESWNLLVVESRHSRIRILGTAQRPAQIHNNLLNLAQETNIFRTEDVERLRSKLQTKENLELARQLEKFEFFNVKNGEPVLCSVPNPKS